MKTKFLFLISCFVFNVLAAQTSNPVNSPDLDTTASNNTERLNPWQQAKGEVLISPYLSHYVATSYRDADGNKIDFANGGKYSNYNPRVFIAAPLFSEHVNVIASLPYFFNRSNAASFHFSLRSCTLSAILLKQQMNTFNLVQNLLS